MGCTVSALAGASTEVAGSVAFCVCSAVGDGDSVFVPTDWSVELGDAPTDWSVELGDAPTDWSVDSGVVEPDVWSADDEVLLEVDDSAALASFPSPNKIVAPTIIEAVPTVNLRIEY